MKFKKSKGFAAALSLAILLPCASTGFAQSTTTGSVSVNVIDPSGAALAGAQLEIKDHGTNVLQKATTLALKGIDVENTN